MSTPTAIEIIVRGTPVPGGSKRAFAIKGRNGSYLTRPNGSPIIRVTDDAKGNAAWKKTVADAGMVARLQAGITEPWDGPVRVRVRFFMPRPKGHFRTNGTLKPSAPRWPTVRPDTTKLWRAVEDALIGVLWAKDETVVSQMATKEYATDGCDPGVIVTAELIQDGKLFDSELFKE